MVLPLRRGDSAALGGDYRDAGVRASLKISVNEMLPWRKAIIRK
jgi:hypothetical protein